MTALAMLIGMLPMALGLGDGGEQNAPLGRAVIGGLFFGTVTTSCSCRSCSALFTRCFSVVAFPWRRLNMSKPNRLLMAALLATVLIAVGSRIHAHTALRGQTSALSVPTVSEYAQTGIGDQTLDLPPASSHFRMPPSTLAPAAMC